MFKIAGEDKYGFEIKLRDRMFRAILRMPNGHDILWLHDSNLDFKATSTFVKLFERLHNRSSELINDLELADFETVAKVLQKQFLSKCLVNPQTLLEIIFIVGGKKFESNWKDWLDTPVETLLDMVEISKKYPSAF